jgi:hypothetical protein
MPNTEATLPNCNEIPVRTVMSRPLRLAPLALLGALALGGAGTASAQDDRDRMTIGTQRYEVTVLSEGSQEISFRMSAQSSATIKKKTRDLRGPIIYAGMLTDGSYKKGKESQARGAYAEAADFFDQLVSGNREWEQVYGAMSEGDCLELAKKYTEAAACFDKVVGKPIRFTTDDDTNPRHRLWQDACYREGVALAEAGDAAGAGKIADGLLTYSKLTNSVNPSGAENRSAAIKAAIAAQAGDIAGLQNAMVHVNFQSSDDPDVWFHFNIFMAGADVALKKPSDALDILQAMAGDDYLVRNPSRKAEVEILQGDCLFSTDPQAALIDLLRIDAMPYGSEDQRCQACAEAGELLADQAATLKDAKQDTQVSFHKELVRTARLLLQSAAGSTSASAFKAKAKGLLDQLGPDPDAPSAEPADKAKAAPGGDTDAPPVGAAPAPEPTPPAAGGPAPSTPAPAPAPAAPPAAGKPAMPANDPGAP